MRSFRTHTSAARFCLAHDEVRDFFRPATRRKEHVPAARRQAIRVQRSRRPPRYARRRLIKAFSSGLICASAQDPARDLTEPWSCGRPATIRPM